MAQMILALLLAVPLTGMLSVLVAHHFPRLRVRINLAVALITLVPAVLLSTTGPQILHYAVGGWRPPFGIELRADTLSRIMILATALVFAAAALYEAGLELAGTQKPGKLTYHITFPLLQLALNGLFLTHDFFNFYVFFELAAVSSYLLVAMGKHHQLEAAWKYAAQSILGSAALVSAVAFIYGITGTLNMSDAAARMGTPVLWLTPFVLVAFLMKGSLFPFHLWQPDAYAAATTAGSAILAGSLANIGLYGFLRFWPLLFGTHLSTVLLWLGAASIVFGAVGAFRQDDAKRLLGLSSTSQLGFVLVGIGWATDASFTAAIVFLFHHSISKALLFLGTGTLADRFESTRFEALAGSGAQAGGLKAAVLLGFVSLIGLPPALGFYGKLGLLSAGIQIGSWPFIGTIAAGTLMTLVYAARAYQLLFWSYRPRPDADRQLNVSRLGYAGIGFLCLVVLAAGLYGRPIWLMSGQAARDARTAPLLWEEGSP